MLAWTIYISFLGALATLAVPKNHLSLVRAIALVTVIAAFVLSSVAFIRGGTGAMTTVTLVPWMPSLGISYHLAADGMTLCLALLTGIVAITGVLFSWNISYREGEFFAFYLLLIGSVYGVFLSYDLLLLFVFYEIVIVPKYFLIAIWGSTRREYGAMKLAIYSFVGSAMVLTGLIAAYVVAGGKGMNLGTLAAYPFPLHFQMWAFPLVFTGFAILAGMWPFHSWAPTGHVAAPTAASMLLAGVVMKLGAYGCLRVAMTLFPLGLGPWGFHFLGFDSWRTVFAVLAIISILYGALVAMVQNDFKFVIGYSSISHMGFILLGLMTLNQIGLSGAVIQMLSHGVLAGLLFAVVGRMLYDRTHTRELSQLGQMHLNRVLPFATVTFVLAGMASMGMPGFSGFIAELMILIGTWKESPLMASCVGVGIVLGVVYVWCAMQKAFFSDNEVQTMEQPLPPISTPERIGTVILITASLAIGLFPKMLLRYISASINSPLFAGLHQGGWR
ncbi:NADH-quinone oxidoreductase subunit M [Granulicella sp. 5B5]|uniref:complex I subunit 4 family protein n=1 Tax=Granulicella sp. 5B5 TaxID=1617967 RepID=UPI0015F47186|nr:NADH-quinone oxidoreductase subunit M [Granulicella sp. 5B5]QMV17289.1 NADH-quinone oxidoreductase subunit M [Granulicella sp. 5B5]